MDTELEQQPTLNAYDAFEPKIVCFIKHVVQRRAKV